MYRINLRNSRKNFLDKNEQNFWERWENENHLVNCRLTWLLTAQGLLFAAYGVIAAAFIQSENPQQFDESFNRLLTAIKCVGFSLSVLITLGIFAAVIAQRIVWCSLRKPFGKPMGINCFTTIAGWASCLLIPILFAFIWWFKIDGKLVLKDNGIQAGTSCCAARCSSQKTNMLSISDNVACITELESEKSH